MRAPRVPAPALAGRLLSDRRGGAPANLIWLMLFIVLGGVAMDTMHASQVRTQMQATADAAALAAVRELPMDEPAARATAISFVEVIAPPAVHGELLVEDTIRLGKWDGEARSLGSVEGDQNAVALVLRRTAERGNPVWASFLQLLPGFSAFDVEVAAVAAVEWRRCPDEDGIVTTSHVRMKSQNGFGDDFCVFGQDGISLYNGNDFTGDVVSALAGVGRDAYFENSCRGLSLLGRQGAPPTCSMDSNPGLADALFTSDDILPRRLDAAFAARMGHYRAVFDGVAFPTLGMQADGSEVYYFDDAAWRGSGRDRDKPNDVGHDVLTADLGHPKVVDVACGRDDDVLELRHDSYAELTLITNCLLEISGSGPGNPNSFSGVELVSVSESSFAWESGFPLERNLDASGNGAGADVLDIIASAWCTGGGIGHGGAAVGVQGRRGAASGAVGAERPVGEARRDGGPRDLPWRAGRGVGVPGSLEGRAAAVRSGAEVPDAGASGPARAVAGADGIPGRRPAELDALFGRLDRAITEAGYLSMSGQIVDTTLVAAPRQRNTD